MSNGGYLPAQSINEFANNLMLEALSQEQSDFYVPIYDEKLDEIRDTLMYENFPTQTIYILGQKGTGKTTALNYLPNEEIKTKYETLSLYAHNLFDINDLDIAEFLLMICYRLMDGNKKLEKIFKETLTRIRGTIDGTLETTEEKKNEIALQGGIGSAAKVEMNPIGKLLGLMTIGINVFANLRTSKEARQIVREVFNTSPKEIFDLTNRIIDEHNILKKGDKQLLLIINELDHARNAEKIHQLFLDNRYYIESLKCRKVLSVPLILENEGEFNQRTGVSISYFGLKMSYNPHRSKASDKVKETVEKNIEFLKQIVRKRIAADKDLIREDALDLAIAQSGGILRQFMNIVVFATRKARRQKSEYVSINDIEYGMQQVRQNMEGALKGRDITRLLKEVIDTYTATCEDKNLLLKAFHANQIIAYKNNPTWYSVNPLIKETVEIYASTIEDDEDE